MSDDLDDLIARFGREVVADNLLDVGMTAVGRVDPWTLAAVKARLYGHPSIDTSREGT